MNWILRWAYRLGYPLQLAVWWCLRPEHQSAHAVVTLGDRYLVVRNSYRRGFGFPAGRMNNGESPGEGASRELREEVGLKLSPDRFGLIGVYPNRGEFKTDVAHLVGVDLDEPPALQPDQMEVVWAGFLTPEEIRREPMTEPLRMFLQER